MDFFLCQSENESLEIDLKDTIVQNIRQPL